MIGRKEGKRKDKKEEEGKGREGKRKKRRVGGSRGRKAGRQADRRKEEKEGGRSGAGRPRPGGEGGPAPTALTLKCSVMTMNTSSKAAPLRKGMLIFLSSLPHEPFCFEFKTRLIPAIKAGIEVEATSAPWPCPTSEVHEEPGGTQRAVPPGLTPRVSFPATSLLPVLKRNPSATQFQIGPPLGLLRLPGKLRSISSSLFIPFPSS